MSIRTETIRKALTVLRDSASVNGWAMIHDQALEALAALSELEAQPSQTDEGLYKQAMDDVTPEALSRMDKRLAAIDAQTEDLEAQAGELSDEVIDRIGIDIETELASADWSPVSVAVEVENFKRYARRLRPYLKPSQAIGEQTPVAWMTEDGRLASPRAKALMPSAANQSFTIPLGRMPMSSEARDLAISVLEKRKVALDAALKYVTPLNIHKANEDEFLQVCEALSALRKPH